jgi:hypothetical protein
MKKAKKAEPKEICLNFVFEPSCQKNGADRMNCRICPGDGQEELPFTSGPLFVSIQSNPSSNRPGFSTGLFLQIAQGKSSGRFSTPPRDSWDSFSALDVAS